MAIVVFPKRWSAKPPAAQINWGHPLTSQLQFFVPFFSASPTPIDIVHNLASATATAAYLPGQKGLEAKFVAANSTDPFSFSGQFIPAAGEITVALWQCLDAVGGSQPSSFGLASATPSVCQAHCPYTDNNIYWDYGALSAGAGRLSVAHPSPITGVYYFFVFTSSGRASVQNIYVNGRLLATGSTSVTSITPAGAAYRVGLGTPTGSPNPVSGRIVYNAVWGRALTASEVVGLYNDPWCLLQAQSPRRRLWSSAAAAVSTDPPFGPYVQLPRQYWPDIVSTF